MSAAEAWVMIEGSARTPFEPSAANDAVLQLYTSGTTGNPKGAVLSNRNLFALRKHSSTLDMPSTKWEGDEAVLVAMSCAHIGGTGIGIKAIAAGVTGGVIAELKHAGVVDDNRKTVACGRRVPSRIRIGGDQNNYIKKQSNS